MPASNAFLEGILDYAGLFPPASLDLATALANYQQYRQHPAASMLGRFVVPADLLSTPDLPDRLTVTLAGPPLPALPATVESVETNTLFAAPDNIRVFYELDWSSDFTSGMDRLKGRPNAAVKLRTGGGAIPPAAAVAAFLSAAAERYLPIKFAAGLETAFPTSGQHGFLTAFLAAFAAYAGSDAATIESLLHLGPHYVILQNEAISAGSLTFTTSQIKDLRTKAISFSSSSFLAPYESFRHVVQPE